MASRHMLEFGTTSDALAAVALACRKHAQLNPRALMRGRPMTRDDYYNAPWVTEPYRRFDCCLETDAAAAVLVSSLPTPPAPGRSDAGGVASVTEGAAGPPLHSVTHEGIR